MSARAIAKAAQDNGGESCNNVSDGDFVNETFRIGEQVHIRTVTFHMTGRITRVTKCGNETFLHLEEAAWIAMGKRFYDMLKDGALDEVEPIIGEARVQVGSIVDVQQWLHKLPTKQK